MKRGRVRGREGGMVEGMDGWRVGRRDRGIECEKRQEFERLVIRVKGGRIGIEQEIIRRQEEE